MYAIPEGLTVSGGGALTQRQEWDEVRRVQGRRLKGALLEWLLAMGPWKIKADLTFESVAHPERAEKAVRRWKRVVAPEAVGIVGYERQERGASHAHVLLDRDIELDYAEALWNRIAGWCRVEAVHSGAAALKYALKHGFKGLDYEIVGPGVFGAAKEEERGGEGRKVGRGVCFVCREGALLHVHHLDWHNDNDDLANLVAVCQRCHTVLHQVGYMTREELQAIARKVLDSGRPEVPYCRDGQYWLPM